jgi:hypothetical protein
MSLSIIFSYVSLGLALVPLRLERANGVHCSADWSLFIKFQRLHCVFECLDRVGVVMFHLLFLKSVVSSIQVIIIYPYSCHTVAPHLMLDLPKPC